MRASTIGNGVIKEVTSCEMGDHIINYTWEKKVWHLRVLKFQLNEDTIETCIHSGSLQMENVKTVLEDTTANIIE